MQNAPLSTHPFRIRGALQNSTSGNTMQFQQKTKKIPHLLYQLASSCAINHSEKCSSHLLYSSRPHYTMVTIYTFIEYTMKRFLHRQFAILVNCAKKKKLAANCARPVSSKNGLMVWGNRFAETSPGGARVRSIWDEWCVKVNIYTTLTLVVWCKAKCQCLRGSLVLLGRLVGQDEVNRIRWCCFFMSKGWIVYSMCVRVKSWLCWI